MIKMSVEKETVPTRSTKVDPAPPLPPQKLSESIGSCNNTTKVPEVTLANPDSTDGASTCPMPDSGAQTKHSRSADPNDQTESVGKEAMVTEQHLNPKNGLQQPKQQQQKLSKRRSTMNAGFKHPAGKRRRRANSESDSVLPTNFLLGGNIFDPLNLNSLLDEDVNRALNAETPRSSPLPAKNRDPVEILIPRDITDPLNLNSRMGGRGLLVSPFKSGGRRRHRNRHHGGGGGGSSVSGLDQSDSERSGEVTNTTASSLSNLASASAASASVFEAPSVPAILDPCGGDGNEINPSNSRDEATLTVSAPQAQPRAPEDSSAATSGGSNQLTSRPRKRRRNSSKTDPPMAQSTPMSRSGTEEKGRGAGPGRNAQSSFQTPVVGPRGSSQQQQPHNQHKRQQHQGNKKKFQYGNYNKYYGYRNPGCSEDPRFRCLRPEWFQGKAVLDLGCNTGHLTLCIAKKLRPARILGLDIDGGLVHAARQNIRHYLSELQAQEARRTTGEEEKTNGPEEERKEEKANRQEERKEGVSHSGEQTHKQNEREHSRAENGNVEKQVRSDCVSVEAADGVALSRRAERRDQESGAEEKDSGAPAVELGTSSFPVSLHISRGPIAAPPLPKTPTMPPGDFPSNVSFIKGNYVLESDVLLLTQRPEYDVILCFSVTKWVHLNWGDGGLKRLFHRVFRHLRPGGMFILEPQPWITYGKRKKLTDSIFRNYHSIRLKPEQFSTYLTSEVGFSSYELIGTPNSSSRGFQRPIYLFHKGT
ncbi:7SK snRNA methylphosphate capping enzyme-like [Salvelinus namaycush]|uniref:RNA methyltransferase n=1 Tax=Salvelinus namaycush TaxID=8040 RepID=A0A8U1BW15_SALNM|nr:7SK snRNA methylphosphate capping enzyme-like [Salvelinus namaycush]